MKITRMILTASVSPLFHSLILPLPPPLTPSCLQPSFTHKLLLLPFTHALPPPSYPVVIPMPCIVFLNYPPSL